MAIVPFQSLADSSNREALLRDKCNALRVAFILLHCALLLSVGLQRAGGVGLLP